MLKRRYTVLGAALACLVAWPGAAMAQEDQTREPWEQNQQQNQQDQNREPWQQDEQREQQGDQGDQQMDQQQRDQQDRQRQQAEQQRREQQRQEQDRQRQDQARGGSGEAALGIALARSDDQGARVLRVFRNSPANEMGLRDGDLIVAVNGQEIQSNQDLIRAVDDRSPGEQIRLEVERNGNSQQLSGKLETRRQAFVTRDSRRGERRMFSREGRRGSGYRGEFTRSDSSWRDQDVRSQLNSLERQVNRIQRQLEDLRVAIEERGQRSGDDRDRASTASYDEYDSNRTSNQRTSSDGQSRSYDQSGSGERDIHDSPGGEVGEDRLRTDSNEARTDSDW